MSRMRMQVAKLAVALALVTAVNAGGTALGDENRTDSLHAIAALTCTSHGGFEVALTLRNVGRDTIEIDDDFHLFLSVVHRDGREELVGIVFVFPAPGFDEIRPGRQKTFIVPIDPGVDLPNRPLVLEAEIFLDGHEHPVVREFTFPGCP